AGIEVDELDNLLPLVARGEFEVEERPTLQVQLDSGDGGVVEDWALNEVSIEKTARQRLLVMDVHVGESLFARVPADALVIATATGSTAYGFSAGGPILSPNVDATVVIPVAPHSLFGRALVVGADEVIRVRVLEDQAPAVASCDGRSPISVPEGGWVAAVGRGRPVRIARTGDGDFYSLVRRKFGLR
ncbi:MAG TPA: hypothetical protein VGV67_06970, partial [Solirubrobacteraceae bacterium]|nr:hypothetical protein [Solirubrobacteraceae bacterium]